MTVKTAGLKKYSDKKRDDAKALAASILTKLIKSDALINFNTVAAASGLSKTYLYNNSEIRKEIEKFRYSQKDFHRNEKPRLVTTDKGKDVIILALKHKIEELSSENAKLKKDNSLLRGQIYELS